MADNLGEMPDGPDFVFFLENRLLILFLLDDGSLD
jgi:hypothetical protein